MGKLVKNTDELFLSGLFSDQQNAETAYDELRNMGYSEVDINVAMTSTTRDKLYAKNSLLDNDGSENITPVNGAVVGGTTGGLLGGIAFAIGALGSNLFIPGLGLVLMGPVAAGLLGAGAGGITGGIIGNMIAGDPTKTQADLFTSGLKDGKIILAFVPHHQQDEDLVCARWKDLGAVVIHIPRRKT
ncbi:hypothetical protein LJ707_17685 [Mucilaginibacter sp. UR6-1]|uniref:hypothetical protein n=1 Tax=Mucilaginibacter sp. UR6-1 TaxID=1435643 RepID=UPI001E366FE0|nr:hypothetical protein [Mucilaginibacter sp. UR6-1]MCC8410778.1 hypothetical protein [Mucilaginibacter sp. UR6-1]